MQARILENPFAGHTADGQHATYVLYAGAMATGSMKSAAAQLISGSPKWGSASQGVDHAIETHLTHQHAAT